MRQGLEEITAGVGELWLAGQIQSTSYFVNSFIGMQPWPFLFNLLSTEKLSSWNRDCMTHKLENIYNLALHRKCLLTPEPHSFCLFLCSSTEEHILGQFAGRSGGERLKVIVGEWLIDEDLSQGIGSESWWKDQLSRSWDLL